MIDYQKLADDLIAALQLSQAPIALLFCDTLPANLPAFDGVVPAGCSFWQLAATRKFVTSTQDHELCAIGVHTHNLAGPSAAHHNELSEVLAAMSGWDYVRAEEVAAIPVLKRKAPHVVDGPLAEFSSAPDLVLLFTHAQQGLILSEAVSRVDKDAAPAMGRPACAVVPQVLNQGRAAMSLGCCGARAYLDSLSDEVALWALPGAKLEQYCAEVATLARANRTLATYHARRKQDVESGERPTVRDSLGRISS